MYNRVCLIGLILAALPVAGGCSGKMLGKASGNVAAGIVDRVVAQPDSTVELLESELRWMEDNLYRMDDQLDRAIEQLDSARRNNAILRLELAEARGEGSNSNSGPRKSNSILKSNGSGSDGSSGSGGDDGSDSGFDEESGFDDADFLTPPQIETGEPSVAPGNPTEAKPETATPTEAAPLAIPDNEADAPGIKFEGMPETIPVPSINEGPANDKPAGNPFEDQSSDTAPTSVTRVLLNKRLTGGYSFDGKRGHEGIMVVLEPQDAFARYQAVAGEVEIEVRDISKSGLAARVGKWKFDPIESEQRMKKTLLGEGLHFQLPWPAADPQHDRLKVLVSYQTPDGRTLKAEREILVDLTTDALAAKASRATLDNESWSPNRFDTGTQPVKTASKPEFGNSSWRSNR